MTSLIKIYLKKSPRETHLIRQTQILQYLLGKVLALAVWTRAITGRMCLGYRQRPWFPVNRRTRTVHETEHLGVEHRLQQNAGAGDVVLIVLQWLTT